MSWRARQFNGDELIPEWTLATETRVIETFVPLLCSTLKKRSLQSPQRDRCEADNHARLSACHVCHFLFEMSESVSPKQGDWAMILVPTVPTRVGSIKPIKVTQRRRWMERLLWLSDQEQHTS